MSVCLYLNTLEEIVQLVFIAIIILSDAKIKRKGFFPQNNVFLFSH